MDFCYDVLITALVGLADCQVLYSSTSYCMTLVTNAIWINNCSLYKLKVKPKTIWKLVRKDLIFVSLYCIYIYTILRAIYVHIYFDYYKDYSTIFLFVVCRNILLSFQISRQIITTPDQNKSGKVQPKPVITETNKGRKCRIY